MGIRAFENSLGLEAKMLREAPGPHKIKACSPGEGTVA